MKRLNIKNGDIIQVPLKKYIEGYAYCKYIDPMKVWGGEIELPGILLMYNFISKEVDGDINKINRALLLPPKAIAGIRGALKLGWRVLGNESITDAEKFLPHVKGGWPHVSRIPERWLYYEELGNPRKQHFAEYDDVKHLEMNSLLNIELVPFRIVMEHLRINNMDIKYFVDDMDWLEEYEYNQSKDLPIFITLPEAMKGRAITK